MAGRGPQTFKKRQKEQQRKEKQQEKLARRLQRKQDKASGPSPELEEMQPLDGPYIAPEDELDRMDVPAVEKAS